MSKKKILVTETILRDAHQSLIATRMTMDEMLPILPQLDKIGFHSLECWGGATFDSCLRFLNEDPWERLRTIRKNCPNTKLQVNNPRMYSFHGPKSFRLSKNLLLTGRNLFCIICLKNENYGNVLF